MKNDNVNIMQVEEIMKIIENLQSEHASYRDKIDNHFHSIFNTVHQIEIKYLVLEKNFKNLENQIQELKEKL